MNRPTNMTNYHSHCTFCDGPASMEDFVKEAIRQGFTSYGISSHAPLPFPTRWTMEREDVPDYLHEICRLKQQYAGEIEIYAGMEIDYLDAGSNPGIEYFRQLPLDYRIGSVHLLESLEDGLIDIDTPVGRFKTILPLYFGNNLEKMVRKYFAKLMAMVETGGFDILGHADKMSYNASCCDPSLLESDWYNRLIQDYFSLVASKGIMMEINTKAYDSTGVFFPNVKYFPLLRDLHIPVLVNSDAHFPARINSGRAEALAALKANGIPAVMELHHGEWEETPIG